MYSRRGGWLVWLAAISFFFAQLAVAAYACTSAIDSAAVPPLASGEGDCHRSLVPLQDAGKTQLCKAHCEHGAQAKPSPLGDLPDLARFTQAAFFTPVVAVESLDRSAYSGAPHGGPPLYLRHCVLRN